MGEVTEDGVPVGMRLGSERLYDEHSVPTSVPVGLMPPVGRSQSFIESITSRQTTEDGVPVAAPEPPAVTNLSDAKARRESKKSQAKRGKQPPTAASNVASQGKQADQNPRDLRGIVSSALELAGIAAITAGCAMVAPWLAFVVGGILLAVLGVATGWNVTE